MQKLTYGELSALFRAHEATRPGTPLTGHIVFTQNSFDKPYPLEMRTYIVRSDNKAFRSGASGYSIFGTSLDGSDVGIRLEQYMAAERGGKDGWEVDYCFLPENP